jgi:hypothetical protein
VGRVDAKLLRLFLDVGLQLLGRCKLQDLDGTASLDMCGGGGVAGKGTMLGSSKAIQTGAWEILVCQDFEVGICSHPGHGSGGVDVGSTPTVWYSIV